MKMGSSTSLEYYFVIGLFFILLFLVSYGKGCVPHVAKTSLQGYPYEGFTNAFTESDHGAASVLPGPLPNHSGVLGIFPENKLQAGSIHTTLIYDPVSTLQGSPACIGKSNNYFNSLGGLCITKEVQDQFQSRGGNQTSSPAEIGTAGVM